MKVPGLLTAIMVATLAGISPDVVEAGLQGDATWVVDRGDSVYSIARKVFPDDPARQRRFRKELVEGNPDVFDGDMNRLGVGQSLVLPAFATSTSVKTTTPASTVTLTPADKSNAAPVVADQSQKANSVRFAKTTKPAEADKAVTPDPEDIIGQVVISIGDMQADNRGMQRDLERRSPILKGDTITTSERAYTQIRMKDGALISLRPKTKLRIIDYNFNGAEDGSERSFMELLAGGFRTITGYIGHLNKQNYRVKTAVATIGIRGTHYGLMLCEAGSCIDESPDLEDGVYGGVVDGSIVVENDSGISTFNNDQYFHIASFAARPVEKLVPPPVFHGRADRQAGRQGTGLAPGEAEDKEQQDASRQEIAGMGPGVPKRSSGGLGTLVQSYVDDTTPPLVLADQEGNDIIGDIPDDDIIDDKLPGDDPTVPTEVLAPPGAAVLIALNSVNPVDGSVDKVTAGVRAGSFTDANGDVIVGEIKLGSLVDTDGVVINNLPVAIYESSPDTAHVLELPSGVAGIKDTGGDTIGVNWGRWADSYTLNEKDIPIEVLSDLHYIYSDNLTTPDQLSALGGLDIQLYQHIGGTTPTNMLGQAAQLVSLEAQADFVTGKLDYYQLHLIDGGVDFNMEAVAVPFENMGDMQLTPYLTCDGCTGRATAAFVGSQAEGMITTYSVEELGKGGNGAALLIRGGAVAQ